MLPLSEAGEGPAVVLLHAGICDRTMWDDLLPRLADAGYRAIAPDLPGFGEAKPAPGTQRPWIDLLVTLDELGVDRAALVGNSFGGGVALATAVTLPARFWALALCSSPAPGLTPSAALQAAWAEEEAALERGDTEAAVEAVVRAWTSPTDPEEVRERVAAMQRRTFALQDGEVYGDGGPDPAETPGALAALDIPALVAAGDREFQDFIDAADDLAGTLPRAERVTFDGAGHLAPLEQPEAFAERLLAFLDACRP